MTELFPPSIDDQIACVEREISYRVRVYDRRVLDRKMSQKMSDRELSRMRAVLETLQEVKATSAGPAPGVAEAQERAAV